MTKSNKTISPLRQRMLDDMAIRKLGTKTRKDYIRAVVNFTRYRVRFSEQISDDNYIRVLTDGWLKSIAFLCLPRDWVQVYVSLQSASNAPGCRWRVTRNPSD